MEAVSCHDQIMGAPERLVKAVLLSMCDDKEVEKTALARLSMLTEIERKIAAEAPGQKRNVTGDLAICIQCESPFFKNANNLGDCFYHTGDMDVDEEGDFWADHDEMIHGEIDSKWARKEYPEGFIWSCCDKNAEEAVGCTKGHHEADPQKVFKRTSAVGI